MARLFSADFVAEYCLGWVDAILLNWVVICCNRGSGKELMEIKYPTGSPTWRIQLIHKNASESYDFDPKGNSKVSTIRTDSTARFS
ncbi:MAG: hypothetical protein P8J33_12665, partial [Pirellulaceae bacterium]|nr:hypothetical protein [Pirellulaceae bacterium]